MLKKQLEQKQASLVMTEKKFAEGWQEVTTSETQFQSLSACIDQSNVEQLKAKVMKSIENLKEIECELDL
jgi:hypothetical protein